MLYEQTQFPVAETPHHSTVPSFQYSKPEAIVRNKPNSAGAERGANVWWERSYDGLTIRRASEKQSQFPTHGQGGPRAGRAARDGAAGPKRAKQTQFGQSGMKGTYLMGKEL